MLAYIGWCWAHTQCIFYFRREEVNMESCCSDVYQSCWYWVFRNSLPLVLWHIVGIIHQRIFEIFYWILYHLNAILVLYFSIMIIELVCGLMHLQFCISWIIVDCISSEAAALVPRHQMIPMQVSISLNQF